MASVINALIAKGGDPGPGWDYLDSMEKINRNRLVEQKLADYPEERDYLRKKRAMDLESGEINLSNAKDAQLLKPMQNEIAYRQYVSDLAGNIPDLASYEKVLPGLVSKANALGINANFPDPNQMSELMLKTGKSFQQIRDEFMLSNKDALAQLLAKAKYYEATKPDMSDNGLLDRAINQGDPKAAAIVADKRAQAERMAILAARERGASYGENKGGDYYDKLTGETGPVNWNKINANPGRYISTRDPDFVQRVAEARQRGSVQTANVAAASEVYDKEAPELIALRNKVAKKNKLPTGQLTDLEAVNQWLGEKTSDPDVVLLKKKTKLLADSLQKTFGGSQGGQWAFEVASDILNPSFAPAAFERVINSHGDTLREMAKARRNFGKNDTVDNATPKKETAKEDPLGIR